MGKKRNRKVAEAQQMEQMKMAAEAQSQYRYHMRDAINNAHNMERANLSQMNSLMSMMGYAMPQSNADAMSPLSLAMLDVGQVGGARTGEGVEVDSAGKARGNTRRGGIGDAEGIHVGSYREEE